MEIESALVAHPRVAEAAVVGRPHDVKGESVFAYVVLRGARPTGDTSALVQELRNWVGEQLGPIAKPDDIRFADNLPKTRSGKIMRRLLKTIARGEEITQDVSTLENPAILDQLRGADAAPKATPAKAAPAKSVPAKATPVAAARKAAAAPQRARTRPTAESRKLARKKPKKAPKKVAKKVTKKVTRPRKAKAGTARPKTKASRARMRRAVRKSAMRRGGRRR
jgi:hypothetical protein